MWMTALTVPSCFPTDALLIEALAHTLVGGEIRDYSEGLHLVLLGEFTECGLLFWELRIPCYQEL